MALEKGAHVLSGPEDIEFGPAMIPDEPVRTTTTSTILKLVDPAGVVIEVTEMQRRDPLKKVSLNVSDLQESIKFYKVVIIQIS